MRDGEIVREVLEDTGVSQAKLGRMVGMSTANVHDKLVGKGMKIVTFVKMLKALDYKVVVMPSNKKTPEGAYVLEEM